MNSIISSALAHLQLLFPHADPSFLLSSLHFHFALSPPPNQSQWTSAALVERVSEKLLDHSYQEYPKVAWISGGQGKEREREGIASMDKVRKRWNTTSKKKDDKGQGKEIVNPDGAKDSRKVTDVTLGRNIALTRLHSMFPLVPISRIRRLLLSIPHSFLHEAVEVLLAESLDHEKNSSKPPPNPHPRLFKFSTFFNQLFLATRAPPESTLKQNEEEPILRHQDLFRITKENRELIRKFEFEFPTLVGLRSKGSDRGVSLIQEVVVMEGGSLDEMRGKFERFKREEEEGLAKGWLQKLFSVRRDEAEESSLNIDGNSRQNRAGLKATTEEEEEIFECECCYSSIPSSPDTTATCTSSPNPHKFCSSCIIALSTTHAFGQTTSPSASDDPPNFGISCPSTSTCNGTFSLPTLRRILPRKTFLTLQKRSIISSISPSLSLNESLHFCPNCPYAEIISPTSSPLFLLIPLYSLPVSTPHLLLSFTFQTLVGFISLLILFTLALLISLLPSVRISSLYLSLYPNEPLSVPRATATFPQLLIASFDSPFSSSTHLALKRDKIIWLKPWRLPVVSWDWIEGLAEVVQRRKEGRGTVFRCRRTRDGRPLEELSKRVVGIDEILNGGGREGEVGEDEEGEARIEWIKNRIWPDHSSTQGLGSIMMNEFCGIYSCLLCSTTLNPNAPSLHRCESSTVSSPAESLRLALENAASEAVRRVCRKCGTSGIKDEGCNKVVCRCGQAFCWSCKEEIGVEGYRHYCQHFTMPGQSCQQCEKCLLYKEPDEKELVREAVQTARRKWMIEHPELVDQVGDGMAVSIDLTERNRAADWATNKFEQFATKLLRVLL